MQAKIDLSALLQTVRIKIRHWFSIKMSEPLYSDRSWTCGDLNVSLLPRKTRC